MDKTTHINLEGLNKLCKDDAAKKLKYLRQYLESIPTSIITLNQAIDMRDKKMVMKELHFMSPQLMFFGIDDYLSLIERKNNDTLSFLALKRKVEKGISKIEESLIEIECIIKELSDKLIT